MFSSNNLFSHITCPYFKASLCERPRCFFNHNIKIETETIEAKQLKNAKVETNSFTASQNNQNKINPRKRLNNSTSIDLTFCNTSNVNFPIVPSSKETSFTDSTNSRIDSLSTSEEIPSKSKKQYISSTPQELSLTNNKSLTNSKTDITINDKNAVISILSAPKYKIKNEKDKECFKLFNKAKLDDSKIKKIEQNQNPTLHSSAKEVLPNSHSLHNNSCGNSKIRIAHAAAQNIKIASPIEEKINKKLFIEIDNSCKISANVRQKFLDKFIIECIKIMETYDEAEAYAFSEEKLLRSKCNSNRIYLTRACNIINNIRNNKSSLISKNLKPNLEVKLNTTLEVYESLEKYILSVTQLESLGFPQRSSTDHSQILLKNIYAKHSIKTNSNPDLKICCRCSKNFNVNDYLLQSKSDTCIYHAGSSWKKRINGSIEYIYNCCQGDINSKGCQSSNFHVYDDNKWTDLTGYQDTFEKISSDESPTIFALDCEMVYTTGGLELARVTVVDHELKTVLDKLVCPNNIIIDYNTKFSGITKELMDNVTTTFQDIQASLLFKFSSQSILIGHSLESDLISLKLIHNKIIDTSITFPHHIGLPYKRSLKNIATEFLRKIIQDDVAGHDSREDAATCMELMLWKIKKDIKKKKVPTATLR